MEPRIPLVLALAAVMVQWSMIEEQALFTLDALSEDLARIEAPDGRLYEVPAEWVPPRAVEGDRITLRIDPNDSEVTLRFKIDREATEEQRNRVRAKLDALRERGG